MTEEIQLTEEITFLLQRPHNVIIESDFTTVNSVVELFALQEAELLLEQINPTLMLKHVSFVPASVHELIEKGDTEVFGRFIIRPYKQHTYLEVTHNGSKYYQIIVQLLLWHFVNFWFIDQAKLKNVSVVTQNTVQLTQAETNTAINVAQHNPPRGRPGGIGNWVREQFYMHQRQREDVFQEFLTKEGVTTDDPKAMRNARQRFYGHINYEQTPQSNEKGKRSKQRDEQ